MNRNKLFHNASLRLTTAYLSIIMTISVLFSLSLYRVSYQEIERGIDRQRGPVAQILISRGIDIEIEELRNGQKKLLDESRERLINRLIFINTSIFFFGGLLSYYLARKTLQPIEEVHEAQSRFAADASHELKTPITAMRVETEITLTDPKLNLKMAKDQLISNIEELDKLTALSNNLLKLSRLENTQLKLSKTNLNKILELAISNVKPLADQKNQKIVLSNMSTDLKVAIDKDLFEEAITTILDNAIKYSPNDSSVTISVNVNPSTVEIKISDEGIGIPEKDLPHIFDRFYRADQSRTKNTVAGFGIGLSIANETIKMHKGSIKVKSTIGEGTTFTVTLPS